MRVPALTFALILWVMVYFAATGDNSVITGNGHDYVILGAVATFLTVWGVLS